jgi:acyl-CoA synthetase (AMP-forming)/AMP-acid ligase II
MPDVIRRAASLFGDNDYVVLPDRRISFSATEKASRRLAKELLAAGVTKGTRVGIHLPSGPEWVTVFIAVARIGALAMPFSTLYKPAELRTAMRVGDVSVLISASTILGKDNRAFLQEALPGLRVSTPGRLRIPEVPYLRSLRLISPGEACWAERLDLLPAGAGDIVHGVDERLLAAVEAEVVPADPMVVIFTSGTAAEPKAVVHTHGAALRKTSPFANAALNAMFPGRVLSLMPFFWIGGMQEVLAAAQSGAALVTLERRDAATAVEVARRERVTSIKEASLSLRSLFEGVDRERDLPDIRPLPPRQWEGGPSRRGDMAIGIGMTETFGPWSNVDGFECRIVDPETKRTAADGEIGEFVVGGYGLMHGLYKREREEVFTADGRYATGDLGYLEDGKYYFRARLSDLIKTKGANVAPAEVEAVLMARPEVRLAFVSGHPHDVYGEEIRAAVVAHAGMTVDDGDLLAECRGSLSSYKVPTTVVVLASDEVPYLASGKPDRRAIARLLARR